MKIYIDSDYKCHLVNDGTMTEVEADFFNNKCDAFIEGYRYVPAGETWVREDGAEFVGEMIAPWRNYNILAELQGQYEEILTEAQVSYEEGVNSI
jgi:hypothetical protein